MGSVWKGLRRWLHEHHSVKHATGVRSHDGIPAETLGQLADWLETLAP